MLASRRSQPSARLRQPHDVGSRRASRHRWATRQREPAPVHIKLDLRQAQLSATETHIHTRALYGNIDLLVPEGVEVEVQARTRLGRTKLQAGSAIPGAPRIVLTGGTFSGNINVRHPRLWEKLGRRGRRTG